MHTTTISLRPSLATKARRTLHALAASLRRMYHHGLRASQAHATARALNELDDRMLQDLGLSRSELPSAAAELTGLAPRDRQRTQGSALLPR